MNEQNVLLDGMGNTMGSADDALSRTMVELRRVAASRSGGHMCMLFLFAFVFFALVYLLLRD